MSEHSDVFDLLDTVVGDMKRRREPSVNPNGIGDKLAGLLDPARRLRTSAPMPSGCSVAHGRVNTCVPVSRMKRQRVKPP